MTSISDDYIFYHQIKTLISFWCFSISKQKKKEDSYNFGKSFTLYFFPLLFFVFFPQFEISIFQYFPLKKFIIFLS